jgi:glycosyltransferase involved in cell wall biosynthesis
MQPVQLGCSDAGIDEDPRRVAGRCVVVLQSGLFRSGDSYWMKEVLYEYLASRIVPLFDQVAVATPVTTSEEDRFQHARLEAPSVRVIELQRRVPGWITLLRAIATADVAWVFLPSVRGLAAGLVCRALRTPYAIYYGGDIGLAGGRLPHWARDAAFRFVVSHAGAVIAAGGELVESVRGLNPRVEPTVPAIGLRPEHLDETERLLVKPTERNEVFRWLYVGNTHPWKRPDVLLRAFATWRATADRLGELHMVGPGPQGSLRALAADLGVADCVHWHGYVRNGESLFAIYRSSDVFVLASEYEGFPRVLYEAMAFGLPVVTTPVAGVPYLLSDGRDCLMVPMDSPERMAAAVARLAAEPELRSAIVENALKTVRPILEADGPLQVRQAVQRTLGSRSA